jgi:hypothetical protein
MVKNGGITTIEVRGLKQSSEHLDFDFGDIPSATRGSVVAPETPKFRRKGALKPTLVI